jgi:hypothetical protein
MADFVTRTSAPASTFTPPASKASLLEQCLQSTITGRPLPEGIVHECFPTLNVPPTVEAGIARIIGAPGK